MGRIERAGKWVKRNPGVAASLTGLVGIIVAAFVLVTRSYWSAEDARKAEARQRHVADDAREKAEANEQAERWERYRSNIAVASAALQLQNSGARAAPSKMRRSSTATGNGSTSTASSTAPLSYCLCRAGNIDRTP